MDDLVSVEWLAAHLGHPGLVVLDATYLPFEPDRDAAAEFVAGHIPGARFLDLKTLADTDDPRPTMAPRLDQFRARMAALDILSPESIVLYDNSPHRTSARAWWLLRLFGVASVAILDGGLEAWRAAGLPLEGGSSPHPSHGAVATGFAHRADGMIADMADIQRAIDEGGAQIVDARGQARFTGDEPDPRPGVAPGHMPDALNLPYSRLFEPDGRWKGRDALAREFAAAGVDPAQPMIFTCGSGITAAGLLFAAHLLGHDDARLYDGSWSEWGADPSTPKTTGAA